MCLNIKAMKWSSKITVGNHEDIILWFCWINRGVTWIERIILFRHLISDMQYRLSILYIYSFKLRLDVMIYGFKEIHEIGMKAENFWSNGLGENKLNVKSFPLFYLNWGPGGSCRTILWRWQLVKNITYSTLQQKILMIFLCFVNEGLIELYIELYRRKSLDLLGEQTPHRTPWIRPEIKPLDFLDLSKANSKYTNFRIYISSI